MSKKVIGVTASTNYNTTRLRNDIVALDQRVEGNEESIRDLYNKTIHYYDSLGSVPADLPEGSFVAVPSEESAGGGGLPVVELTTPITGSQVALSAEETATLNEASAKGVPIIVKMTIGEGDNVYIYSAMFIAISSPEGVVGGFMYELGLSQYFLINYGADGWAMTVTVMEE